MPAAPARANPGAPNAPSAEAARTVILLATADGRLRAGDGPWTRCALGRSGAVAAAGKREGDGATPLALMPLRAVLHRPDRVAPPACALPMRAITPGDGWSDDPADPTYNTLVPLPHPHRHERLWREDGLYDVVVTLGWNDDPPVPGRGSAIFLHCAGETAAGLAPTEGCVALPRDELLALLPRLHPGDRLEVAARRGRP